MSVGLDFFHHDQPGKCHLEIGIYSKNNIFIVQELERFFQLLSSRLLSIIFLDIILNKYKITEVKFSVYPIWLIFWY